MDVFSNIWLGFTVAASLQNLAYCMLGAVLGTIVGVLPGIGPVTTVALLLPISFTLDPLSALIMMAGIYYGAQYGGSTTAILINIPGEASSVVTSLDGHQMARQGRAGPALGIAALGSFFAGCVAALVIAVGAPPLAQIALQFGPAEYFALMVCGLVAAIVLAHGSIIKAIGMVMLGLIFGLAGSDINSGVRRFTFGVPGLADGVEFVALSMAIYGLAEVAINLEKTEVKTAIARSIGRVLPTGATSGRVFHPSFAAPRWARCWACCRAAAPCSHPSPPTRLKRKWRARRASSARGTFAASRRLSPLTTPARRRPWCRC